MAATDLERLIVQLEAQSTKLDKALSGIVGNVDRQLNRVERRTEVMSQRVTAGFGKAGAVIAGFFSARAIIGFITRVSDAADKLQALSDRTGVGTDQLQRLAGAAAKANVDTEQLNDALDIFARNIGRAMAGQGDLAKVMKDLGINAGSDLVTTLLDVADAVQKAKTTSEEYRITMAAFGRSSAELVGFLRQGRDAIREQAEAFNSGISPDAVKRLAEFNQHWKEISVSFTNMAAGPAATALDGLSGFLRNLETGTWPQKLQELAAFFTAGIVPEPLIVLEDKIVGVGNALDVATDKVMRMNAAIQGTPNFFTKEEIAAAADEMVRLQHELAALVKQRPPSAAPTGAKPFGGPPTEKVKTLTELLGEPREGIAKLQKTLDEALQAEQDFVSNQYLLGKETRDRTSADIEAIHDQEIQDLKDFHAEMQAVIDDADVRAAEKRQQEMDDAIEDAQRLQDILRTGVTDSLVDVGLSARHGFGALEDAAGRALERIADLILEMMVLRPLIASLGLGGGGGTVVGSLDQLVAFGLAAKGGVWGPKGQMPLKRYASGGVASRPQLAIFGEGSGSEAFVPLPDGRRIPVVLKMPKIPNGSAAGGPTHLTIRNEVSVVGSSGDAAVEASVRRGVLVAVAQSTGIIQKNFPGLMRKASRDAL